MSETFSFYPHGRIILIILTADNNINQREFFEIAAIEMMKKYGYEAEIKGLLG